MTLRLIVGFVVLLAAAPWARAQTPTFTASFIDVNDDGVWNAGDLPLADFLVPGSYGFNAFVPQPGYTPTGRPVGLVIQGTLVIEDVELVQLYLTGHVSVRGTIVVKQPDVMVDITTVGGDIDVAPGVLVSARGDVVFETMNGGDIRVGAGGRFSTRGDLATVGFDADGTLTLGTDESFQLRGGGYSTVLLHGHDGVTVGTGLGFRAPNHGSLLFLSGGDLALGDFQGKGGYFHIEAYTDSRHPQAKHVRISDSSLQQTYPNGDFRILAGADLRSNSFASDALVLERTLVRTKATSLPLYVPLPVIR